MLLYVHIAICIAMYYYTAVMYYYAIAMYYYTAVMRITTHIISRELSYELPGP